MVMAEQLLICSTKRDAKLSWKQVMQSIAGDVMWSHHAHSSDQMLMDVTEDELFGDHFLFFLF